MQLVSFLIAVVMAGVYCVPWVRDCARHWESWVAARAAWGWVFAGVVCFCFNLEIAARYGVPAPRVQDEFSYLLASDTFSHGRLTNPTHPLWPFFVTFHELQRPSYMSKYPPGQGLMLAVGQVLDRMPILGAWMGAGVLCVVVGWALAGFLPGGWSVVGALLVAVHPTVIQWSQSYWGGTMAGIGGALVIGAAARRAGIALGIGCGILAMSRPYEGAALALVVWIWLAVGRHWRVLVIAAVTMSPLLLWLGYFNYQVTGSAVRWPYLVYERQYAMAPTFLWEGVRRPSEWAAEPGEMREYAERVEVPHYRAQRSISGFLRVGWEKMARLGLAVAPVWLIAAAALGVVLVRDRRAWLAGAGVAVVLLATLGSNWTRSQYVAPALGAVVVLLVAGLREICGRWPSVGRGVGVGVLLGSIWVAWASAAPGKQVFQRADAEAGLAALGGKQLVLVRYLPGHRLDDEWVFNDADIDASAVVWAHDLGWEADRPLVDYFADRQLWQLNVSAGNATIQKVDRKTGLPVR